MGRITDSVVEGTTRPPSCTHNHRHSGTCTWVGLQIWFGFSKGVRNTFSHIYLGNCEGIAKVGWKSFLENGEPQSSHGPNSVTNRSWASKRMFCKFPIIYFHHFLAGFETPTSRRVSHVRRHGILGPGGAVLQDPKPLPQQARTDRDGTAWGWLFSWKYKPKCELVLFS